MSYCDFIAGWTGGVLGLVTGHPFDTVKVNQQTTGIGVVQCINGIYKSHGAKGFFRGLGFPLVANGTLNSIFFGVYGNTVEALLRFEQQGQYNEQAKHRSATNLPRNNASTRMTRAKVESVQASYFHCLLGGMVGGLAQLILACPVEVVKIKLQTQTAKIGTVTRRRGPIDVLRNIIRTQGPRGLYQGIGIMAVRDIPSSGAYMLCYAALSDGLQNWHLFTNKDGIPNSSRAMVAGGLADLTGGCLHCCVYKSLLDKQRAQFQKPYPYYAVFTAAGLAGTISWWTIIPIDVVKSRMQADNPVAPKYHGVRDCVQKIFKAQGYGGFFKGFWILSLRAFPVNGATFLAFEWIDWTCRSLTGEERLR